MSKKTNIDYPLPEYKEEQEAIGQRKLIVNPKEIESCVSPGITGHNWRQKGPYLVCNSCKIKHAIYIGLTKRLKQIKTDGEIVLEDVT